MGESDDKIEPHILQQYDIVKKIGCGAYGIVWKVIDKKHKTIHALKKNFDAFQNSTDAQRTYRQIMFLNQVKHPNIISLQKLIKSQNERDIYLVFQYMDIDLYTLIKESILQQKHKRYIIYQVAKAVYYLHTGELIHRDIKPSNILVNQNCYAKMCDFGLVRSVQEQDQQQPFLTEYIATRWYRAPQILLGSKRYCKAVDVWSFGCLIGQIIKGRPLFPGNSTLNQIQRVLTWTGPPTLSDMKSLKTEFGKQMLDLLSKIKKISKHQWFPNVSSSAYDLMAKTLQFNPQKRLTMLQILQHPYLRQFYNQQQIIKSQNKIRLPIDDNKKLSLKDYRGLIYNYIKQTHKDGQDQQIQQQKVGKSKQNQRVGSVKNSLGPSKNLIQTKKMSNSTQKDSSKQKFVGGLSKDAREIAANRTIYKNRIYKGTTTLYNQTSTQKSKAHSLGTSNKSIHKKMQDLNEFKKSNGQQPYNKKYQSLINKKKEHGQGVMKVTKHIKTQGQAQIQDNIINNSTVQIPNSNQKSLYPTSQSKYISGNNATKYHNPQLGDTSTQVNSRIFGSADKVDKKKTVSLHENRRQSQGLAKYMYKHKFI